MTKEAIRKLILDTVSDMVTDFTGYDRREVEELTEEVLDEAIIGGDITIDEIVAHFRAELVKGYPILNEEDNG